MVNDAEGLIRFEAFSFQTGVTLCQTGPADLFEDMVRQQPGATVEECTSMAIHLLFSEMPKAQVRAAFKPQMTRRLSFEGAKDSSAPPVPLRSNTTKRLPTNKMATEMFDDFGEDFSEEEMQALASRMQPVPLAEGAGDGLGPWTVQSQQAWLFNGENCTMTILVNDAESLISFELLSLEKGFSWKQTGSQVSFDDIVRMQQGDTDVAKVELAIRDLFSEAEEEVAEEASVPVAQPDEAEQRVRRASIADAFSEDTQASVGKDRPRRASSTDAFGEDEERQTSKPREAPVLVQSAEDSSLQQVEAWCLRSHEAYRFNDQHCTLTTKELTADGLISFQLFFCKTGLRLNQTGSLEMFEELVAMQREKTDDARTDAAIRWLLEDAHARYLEEEARREAEEEKAFQEAE